ncbi:hypothetical protein SAPIO_CDS4918 [Scedosporium apiospermum]|uniref:Uncharacterized protein n=1 Tax=Pseudallescheria apiosperma TaxID=563466 RepID=A0A084G7C2_PSEDA|nr:uncharacterized protein SAPIO_CDS4918 [Scedosporium apiospermum]KEZ43234.1 hypothetical protein SAPIO_CDS4918 [Scedosporium apiospermum]
MLLNCISNAKVVYHHGFHLLHAVHAVHATETFLTNLRRRGCRFHIVWFAAHEDLCVPDATNTLESYLLTCAIPIKHLTHHDDTSAAHGLAANPALKVYYLDIVYKLSVRRYSVAFLNNLEFVYSPALSPSADHWRDSSIPDDLMLERALFKLLPNYIEEVCPSIYNEIPVTARDDLALKSFYATLAEELDASVERCIMAYIVHLVLLRQVDLSKQSLTIAVIELELDILYYDSIAAFSRISVSILEEIALSPNLEWDIADLIDSHVFYRILQTADSLKLPALNSLIPPGSVYANDIYVINFEHFSWLPPCFLSFEPQRRELLDLNEHV